MSSRVIRAAAAGRPPAARSRAGAARARPARGVLRPDRHRLAAPQDPGRLLPGGGLAHLRAPAAVGRRRDDLRRAALRHRHHRRARPGRPGRRATTSSTAWSTACWSAAPDIRMLFLVGSCPSEVIKLDLSRAAERLSRRIRAAGAGAELLRQRHRDHLHAGRGRLPRRAGARAAGRAAGARPRCWWSARWPTWSRTSSRRLFARSGHRPTSRFLPARRRGDACPPSGPNTRFLLAQPFLADTARALEARGAQRTRRALPARRRRHHRLAAAPRPRPSASTPQRFDARHRRRPRARAQARWRASAQQLAGKRIFFFPDSQLEMPLARFLARELGMELVEVGTPYLHRQHLAARTGAAARRHRLSAKARTSSASSTAAAPRGPTSWSAASAWPIRWRPRA